MAAATWALIVACGLPITGDEPFTDAADAATPDTDGGSMPDVFSGVDAGVDGEVTADGGDASATDAADGQDVVDSGPTTAVGAAMVSSVSLTLDRVSRADGPIRPDTEVDGAFDVALTGPAIAVALIRTDAAGAPSASEEWDTWVGPDAIPSGVGAGFAQGSVTWQLAIYENGVLLNDDMGRVALSAGAHSVRIFASSTGSFASGSYFRVILEDPAHGIVRSPVVTY